MEDGSKKSIEDIAVGDRVLGYGPDSPDLRGASVSEVFVPRDVEGYYEINHQLRVTGEHPMLVSSDWVKVRDLRVGDMLTRSDGSSVPIKSLALISEPIQVYNMSPR